MSGGPACRCPESKKPLAEREWVVVQRECNHSAFNGYHWTPSDYSTVKCLACGTPWRTKAKYVSKLRDPRSDVRWVQDTEGSGHWTDEPET